MGLVGKDFLRALVTNIMTGQSKNGFEFCGKKFYKEIHFGQDFFCQSMSIK